MTTELVQFKCPSCGHSLGEEEYRHACKTIQEQTEKKALQQSQQRIIQLKAEQKEEIRQIKEKNALERETEVNLRVAKVVKEQTVWIELKHKQELAIKDKQIETARSEATFNLEERISQAVAENDTKHRQREKEFDLQSSRIEEENKNLMKQVEKLQKTVDNIPPELRGTAGEFVLLDELKKEFDKDEITPKKVGVAMADIVQIIVTEKGERISTPIVYDKKTGDKVRNTDLEKAKNYKRIHNTDHCIIVTKDINQENRFTETRDGILLVHPLAVVDVAKRIRSFIIENSKLAKINGGRDSKDMLYEFLTSSEYNRDRQTRIEVKLKLDELQRKDDEYHRTLGNKRRELIRKWDELDSKLDGFISDMTQGEESSENKNCGQTPP